MKSSTVALRTSSIIFGVLALMNLLRLITGVPVSVGTWVLPFWMNMFIFIGAALLCIWFLMESMSKEKG
ncbi:MAG TPA: hypothetical protein PKJ28_09795 [Bacteroidales bacterium]|nr:hypothetical protein [Bacteroidales bacterium]HPS74715.1 hypothetical protein [Bacteroidales bacterium]